MAINVVNMERAITLLWKEKAKVVMPDEGFATFTWDDWSQLRPDEGENAIISLHVNFKIPEVIVLTEYDRTANRSVKFSRRQIYKRDNFTCQYCGVQPGPSLLNCDHIIPRSRGGETTWTNVVLSCVKCNSKKDNRTPQEAGMRLREQPIKPKFSPFQHERVAFRKSWKNFVDFAYWNVELQNDNE